MVSMWGEDIFIIETEVSRNGAHLMKQLIEYRNRLSRVKRWKQLDEDIDYAKTQLDRAVVNPSQIRTVIQTFKDNFANNVVSGGEMKYLKHLSLQKLTVMQTILFR